MTKINLRDFYPFEKDNIIEVPAEVAEVLHEAERLERNYIRRRFWNRAHYSLDAEDGIEHDALSLPLSAAEVYERKLEAEQVHEALDALPDKQGRRVYAHCVLGFSQKEIATMEGVSGSTVCIIIDRGLKNMEKLLRNLL